MQSCPFQLVLDCTGGLSLYLFCGSLSVSLLVYFFSIEMFFRLLFLCLCSLPFSHLSSQGDLGFLLWTASEGTNIRKRNVDDWGVNWVVVERLHSVSEVFILSVYIYRSNRRHWTWYSVWLKSYLEGWIDRGLEGDYEQSVSALTWKNSAIPNCR